MREPAPRSLDVCTLHGRTEHSLVKAGRGRVNLRCMACHRERERPESRIRNRTKRQQDPGYGR
jgi:hypothetical protein